jgi:hypothetical protein
MIARFIKEYSNGKRKGFEMQILGYGEDAFTLWALQHRLSNILQHFNDKSLASDCLVFYRPSFGRSGGKNSAEFGEFDAIIVSRQNAYLIESKWDHFTKLKAHKMVVRNEQRTRHQVFSWYLTNWNKKYLGNWQKFVDEHKNALERRFPEKRIAPVSLLSSNLEAVLTRVQKHLRNFPSEGNIKNVLLFFKKNETKPPIIVGKEFELLSIDYSEETIGNFIVLG